MAVDTPLRLWSVTLRSFLLLLCFSFFEVPLSVLFPSSTGQSISPRLSSPLLVFSSAYIYRLPPLRPLTSLKEELTLLDSRFSPLSWISSPIFSAFDRIGSSASIPWSSVCREDEAAVAPPPKGTQESPVVRTVYLTPYDFPPTTLCALPYLVSSAYTEETCDLFGMEAGGHIEISLQIEASDLYQNLQPLTTPPFAGGVRQWKTRTGVSEGFSVTPQQRERGSREEETAKATRQQDAHITVQKEEGLVIEDLRNKMQATERQKDSGRGSSDVHRRVAESKEIANTDEHWTHTQLPPQLNNTYILVLNYNEWAEYMYERELTFLQPFGSRSQAGVYWNSHIAAFKRFPIQAGAFYQRVVVPVADRYTVYLLNADQNPLRLSGYVKYYNPTFGHFSSEMRGMYSAVAALLLLYGVSCAVGCLAVFTVWRERYSELHLMMLCNWALCVFYLLFDCANCKLFGAYGHIPVLFWMLPRIFRKLQDVVLTIIFLFVALGWKIQRSRLSRIEVQFAAGVGVVSFAMAIAEIVYARVGVCRFLFNVMAILCVLVAIHFNLTLLHSHLADSGVSEETSTLYSKYQAYKTFGSLFSCYLMKRVVGVVVAYKMVALGPLYQSTIVENDPTPRWLLSGDEWLFVLVDGLADYAISLGMFLTFRPFEPIGLIKHVVDAQRELEEFPDAPVQLAQTVANVSGPSSGDAGSAREAL